MLRLILFLLLISRLISAQVYNQIHEFGSFEEAVAISINQQGYIFVTDAISNEISKFDKTGKELISKGGFGWNSEAFDFPCDISASTLNVYVADKNNNRIVFLDKDLNYLSELNNDRTDFAYPVSVGTTVQGDLQLLDSDNSLILKLNIDGDFLLKFGDYESGDYTLTNPKKFRISSNIFTYVIEDSSLVIFDQFGLGLKRVKTPFRTNNISLNDGNLFINSNSEIYISKSDPNKIKFNKITLLPKPELIVHSAFHNSRLYILTRSGIVVYQKNELTN